MKLARWPANESLLEKLETVPDRQEQKNGSLQSKVQKFNPNASVTSTKLSTISSKTCLIRLVEDPFSEQTSS